jgi:hypothetical protein
VGVLESRYGRKDFVTIALTVAEQEDVYDRLALPLLWVWGVEMTHHAKMADVITRIHTALDAEDSEFQKIYEDFSQNVIASLEDIPSEFNQVFVENFKDILA